MILFFLNFVLPSAELISTMVQQCSAAEIGKPGVVLLYREYVIVSWPNLQKNILHIRRLVEWSNSKCRALPENDHRQPHGICLNSLSGQLEVCICLQKWACGDLLGQPFLHLEEFCFNPISPGGKGADLPASPANAYTRKKSICGNSDNFCIFLNVCQVR